MLPLVPALHRPSECPRVDPRFPHMSGFALRGEIGMPMSDRCGAQSVLILSRTVSRTWEHRNDDHTELSRGSTGHLDGLPMA